MACLAALPPSAGFPAVCEKVRSVCGVFNDVVMMAWCWRRLVWQQPDGRRKPSTGTPRQEQ
jgi:hypothetical protein